MWRDSFLLPRNIRESRRPAESIEDEFLLNLEKRTNQLRRRDTSSFAPIQEAAKTPFQMALYKQEEERKKSDDDDLDLLARTPVDSTLPGVHDLFADYDPSSEEVFKTIRNPLAPASPVRSVRKQGSLATFLKSFQTPSKPEITETEEEEKRDDEEVADKDEDTDDEDEKEVVVVKKTLTDYKIGLKSGSDESISISSHNERRSTTKLETKDDGEQQAKRPLSTRKKMERALHKSITTLKIATKMSSTELRPHVEG